MIKTDQSAFEYGLKKMVLPAEGGYSNDRNDPGGKTFKGITQATARRNGFSGDVRSLTDTQVNGIYYKDYWVPSSCANMQNSAMAIAHFDTVVNMGLGGAKKVLVNALKKLGIEASTSFSASRLAELVNGVSDQKSLQEAYLAARKERYDSLIDRNPKLGVFRRGWMNRVNALAKLIGSDVASSLQNFASEAVSGITTTLSNVAKTFGVGAKSFFDLTIPLAAEFLEAQKKLSEKQSKDSKSKNRFDGSEQVGVSTEEEYILGTMSDGSEIKIPVRGDEAEIPEELSSNINFQKESEQIQAQSQSA